MVEIDLDTGAGTPIGPYLLLALLQSLGTLVQPQAAHTRASSVHRWIIVTLGVALAVATALGIRASRRAGPDLDAPRIVPLAAVPSATLLGEAPNDLYGLALAGVGAGQPNRDDAARIAVRKAGDRAAGSVMASDAFFPFADGVEEAARNGATAFIQPGGSVRDAEVIAAANEHGLAMVVTGVRQFRH